jgi:glycosyltransferase 2 family protein
VAAAPLSDHDKPGISSLLRARWRQVALGLLFGGGCLALALWGVPLRAVAGALSEADPAWLLPVALLFLVQQTLRAWRQALILQARHPNHQFRTSLSVLCIGFLFINILPARIGEVVRPLLLLEREGIPMGAGFGAVFLERAIDLCAMFVMIALVAWLVPVPARTLVVSGVEVDWIRLGRMAAGSAMPVLLGGLLVVVLGGRPLVKRLSAMCARGGPRLQRLASPILRFGLSFVEGLDAVRQPGRLASILALTAATWSLTGFMYPALAHAFGIEDLLGFGEGVGVLAITMAGMAVPAAPGFAGTYEAFVRGALALFDVAGPNLDAKAVAYALTMHWWLFLVQASTAVFFLAVDRVDVRRLIGALARETRPADDPETDAPTPETTDSKSSETTKSSNTER